MSKTIVCIVEEEVIMNYLFVKELYERGDKVLFITQQRYLPQVEHYRLLFSYIPATHLQCIALAKDGDEDLWDIICRTVRAGLSHDEQYYVNLSGGTRLMSIAVQQVFEAFGAQFFFMPIDRNIIVHSQIDNNNNNDDDIISEISHQVTIAEYLKVNNVSCRTNEATQSEELAQHIYTVFTGNHLSGRDYDLLEDLRDLRNKKRVSLTEIAGLGQLVKLLCIESATAGELSSKEVQYITGGWFEEYIYYAIKRELNPTDVAIGVSVQRPGSEYPNDLDVVFTYKNRLFAIECKTGVGKPALYHQIVYKACALKEALLGMRSNAYIFSLNVDTGDRLQITARNMGITFCGRSYTDRPTRMQNLFQNPKNWII